MKLVKKIGFSDEIMILMISLALICSVLAGFIAFSLARISIVETVENDLKTENQLVIELLEHAVIDSSSDYLENILHDIEEHSHDLFVKIKTGEMSEEEAKEQLASYAEAIVIGETGYVYIMNSKGKLISHPEFEDKILTDFQFAKEQVERKNGYLEYEWTSFDSKESERKALYMIYIEEWDYIVSATVFRKEIKHVVDVKEVESKLQKIHIYGKGFVVAVDQEGILKIHPTQKNENISSEINKDGQSIKELYTRENSSVIKYEEPNKFGLLVDRMAVYAYYEPLDWYVGISIEEDEVLSLVKQLKYMLAIMVCAVMIGAYFIARYYSKLLLRPILELKKLATSIIERNYQYKVQSDRTDEIGDIVDVFNHMGDEVRNNIAKLESANEKYRELNINLEKTVEERTKKLQENNQRLETQINAREEAEQKLKNRNEELEEVKKQLESLVVTDSLTQVNNRHYLDIYMKNVWRTYKEKGDKLLSFLMIDIDYFKAYNDTYGHLTGDVALKEVAQTIQESVRESGDFVARYGGEEFAIVIEGGTEVDAMEIAERIRKSVEEKEILHENSKVSNYITVSIGLCSVSNYRELSMVEMIFRADKALYEAKNSGRNKIKQDIKS